MGSAVNKQYSEAGCIQNQEIVSMLSCGICKEQSIDEKTRACNECSTRDQLKYVCEGCAYKQSDRCPYCNIYDSLKALPKRELDFYANKEVQCKCKARFPLKELRNHSKVCPALVAQCSYCREEYSMNEEEQHLMDCKRYLRIQYTKLREENEGFKRQIASDQMTINQLKGRVRQLEQSVQQSSDYPQKPQQTVTGLNYTQDDRGQTSTGFNLRGKANNEALRFPKQKRTFDYAQRVADQQPVADSQKVPFQNNKSPVPQQHPQEQKVLTSAGQNGFRRNSCNRRATGSDAVNQEKKPNSMQGTIQRPAGMKGYIWIDNAYYAPDQIVHPIHGIVRTFYESNDHIKEQYSKDNGVMEGEYCMWFENGAMKTRQHYKNGLLNGKSKQWHGYNRIYIDANYLDNQLHGAYAEYHPNKIARVHCTYNKGKIVDGPYNTFHNNGNPCIQATYLNGSLTGSYKVFDQNGNLTREQMIDTDCPQAVDEPQIAPLIDL